MYVLGMKIVQVRHIVVGMGASGSIHNMSGASKEEVPSWLVDGKVEGYFKGKQSQDDRECCKECPLTA